MRGKPKGWRGQIARHARAAKLGHAHHKRFGRRKWQSGHSNVAIDRKLGAKVAGWRRSRSGKRYLERRQNRSDIGAV